MASFFQRCLVSGFFGLSIWACGENAETPELSNSEPPNQEVKANATSLEVRIPDGVIDEVGLRRRIATLASDEFGGRVPATASGQMTRDFLIAEMRDLGLKPGNGDSFEQPVPVVEVTVDPAQSYLTINGQPLAYGPEAVYWTKRVQADVSFSNSDLVFVGYGVVAPEYGWDDYADIDVTGKTVVMLVNDPGFATEDPELFKGRAMTYYGRWTYKYEEAARQGAAAAIVIHQTEPAAYGWGVVQGGWTGPQIDLDRPDGGAERVTMEGWIQESVARNLFGEADLDFDVLTKAASRKGFKPVPMTGLQAEGKLVNAIKRSQSANVIGILPGSKRPDEYVLYMAHWDHLSPAVGRRDVIFNGAVDNATGTAGTFSVLEAFANNGVAPDRSIMLVAVTAEESGLLGSAYFAEAPTVPLKNIVGGINIDAILPTPLTKDVIVVGYGSSELEELLNEAAERQGVYLRPDAEPEKGFFYRSDHISLAKKGVPVIYADSGIDFVEGGEPAGRAFSAGYTANRYHKPSDEYSEGWDMSGMLSTLTLLYQTGAALAYSDQWPNWYEGNEFRALRDAQRSE